MIAEAKLSHSSQGRVRIRIPEKRGNNQYFAKLKNKFMSHDGIHDTKINTAAASVLILSNLSKESVLNFAKENKLFEISVKTEKSKITAALKNTKPKRNYESGVVRFAKQIHKVDTAIQHSTYGMLDLTSIVFFSIAGMGIYQIARGHILASGTSLLATAAALIPLQKVMEKHAQQSTNTAS